jgi:hypothetical protein
MTFEQSIRCGLRIEGSEDSDEGQRHRRRYRWGSRRIAELGLERPVIVDYGTGTGHGCSIMANTLGPTAYINGYEPDEAAANYARRRWWPLTFSQEPVMPIDVLTTFGVVEHIEGIHPSDTLAEYADKAKWVVGFCPRCEIPGPRANQCHVHWHLDESILDGLDVKQVWYEPLVVDRNAPNSDECFTREPRGNYFKTFDPLDTINMLFVIKGNRV